MPCQLSAFFSLPLEKYLAVEHLSFPYENEAASPSETASQIWRISSCPAPSRAPCGTVKSVCRGPAAFLAVWIYCAVTYGFLLGFFLGWIPALIFALLIAVVMIYLWPLAAVALLYLIYREFGIALK